MSDCEPRVNRTESEGLTARCEAERLLVVSLASLVGSGYKTPLPNLFDAWTVRILCAVPFNSSIALSVVIAFHTALDRSCTNRLYA